MDGEIPEGWMSVALAECVDRITAGATPKAGDPRYYKDGTIPFARIEDVVNAAGGYLNGTELTVTEAAVRETAVRVYPPGTPLMTMYGTIGAVAVTSRPTAANQAIAAFVGPRLAAGFFRQLLLWHGPRLARLAGQTTQANISGAILKRYAVVVPERGDEQELIGQVLDAIDDAIEKTEAVIAATEDLRKALLQELLTRGVPGWHSEWKTVPAIGTIPACWDVVHLGEVLAATQYGTNASLDDAAEGIPVLRMGNLQNGTIDWEGLKYATCEPEELAGLMLQEGDILFNRTNSIDLVGKVSLVKRLPMASSFASYLVRLQVAGSRADAHWLNGYLNMDATQERIRRMATKGASQANINPTNLKTLVIPRPELNEQRAISRAVGCIEDRELHEEALLAQLNAARSEFADGLLSGRLRVPVVEANG